MKLHSSNAGLGVIEIAIVAGIVSIVFLSIFQLVVLTTQPIEAGVRAAEATYLAEEGIEAARVLRNQSWENEIDPLSTGTTYYPTISSNEWTLSTTNPGPINGTYTRTVVLNTVYRDGDDNISESGIADDDTYRVTSTVTWDDRGTSKSVVLDTYITNFLSN